MNSRTAKALALDWVADEVDGMLSDDPPVWMMCSPSNLDLAKNRSKIDKELVKIRDSLRNRAIKMGIDDIEIEGEQNEQR